MFGIFQVLLPIGIWLAVDLLAMTTTGNGVTKMVVEDAKLKFQLMLVQVEKQH